MQMLTTQCTIMSNVSEASNVQNSSKTMVNDESNWFKYPSIEILTTSGLALAKSELKFS